MRPISWNLLESLKDSVTCLGLCLGILMRYSIQMKSWDGWIGMLGRWKGLGSVYVTVDSLIWVLWGRGSLGVMGDWGSNECLSDWIEW